MSNDLHRRYRRLVIACAVPLALVTLLLGVFQYYQQRASELDGLRQMAIAQQQALNRVIDSARDHVNLMRQWGQRSLSGNPGGGDAAPRFADYLGDPAELARRDPIEAAMAGSLYRLMQIAHPAVSILEHSFYFSGQSDFIALYPQRYGWQQTAGDSETLRLMYEHNGYRQVSPEANPSRAGVWTTPSRDPIGPGLVTTYAAPIYTGDRFMGVVAADLRLDFLIGFLQSMHYPVGRLWLASDGGQILADSEARSPGDSPAPALADSLPGPVGTLLATPDVGRFSNLDSYHVLALPLSAAPWTLLYAVSERELGALLLPRLLPYGVILAGLCLTLLLTQWLLRQRFVNPALALVNYISAAAGDTPAPAPRLPALWQPWLDIVARSFSDNRAYLSRLRDSEALKTAIIDSALDAVITVDECSAIVGFNPRAERMFGYRREVVLGRPLAEIILPPTRRNPHDTAACRYLDTTDLRQLGRRNELEAIRSDGRRFPAEIALSEVKLAERRLFTAYIRDLTQQKQAEAEIARQRDMLHQSEKLSALGSLLAGVAHELNNPLAVVVGRAIMLENEAGGPQFSAGIHKIREAAERCTRIVKTFVSIARQRSLSPDRMQLNTIIEGVVDMLGYGLCKHGVELQLNLAPDLPELWADADQLSQVFMNLVVNAQQAMRSTDRPARLVLETRFDPLTRRVQASVTDTGPGIPPELRARVFEPFYTTKGPGVGLGVGLSVSHAIVRSHDGVIAAESGPDGGARFVITLPLDSRASAQTPPVQPRIQHA